MREARLVGLSQDGDKLILAVAETGEEFAVPVDDRLRAALRGDRARLGQLEIQMESALRPRDIQARIRAGESPEAVAAVAQMPMERVMAFAGPVLAERDHIASLAQRAAVRRRGGEGPTRNLGTWVAERLRTRQVDAAAAEWDAWRREDGRWAVRVSYFAGEAEQVAMFAYDAPGRYAVPDDEEARWLVGEQAQVTAPQSSERRLAAVTDFDISLAPDHGADSYEAGFEDAISITRERHAARDPERHRDREPVPEVGRDTARETGRDTGRDPVRDTGREQGRGARRVHSVPNPDDEPTLIDVPNEHPAAVRPKVRAVERPARLPAEVPPVTPPEERAAVADRFTEARRSEHSPEHGIDNRTENRTEKVAGQPATGRDGESRPGQPESGDAARAEGRPGGTTATPAGDVAPATTKGAPAAENASTDKAVTANGATPAEGEAAAEAEGKKKPARRGSKRASVPSWDEIMFGKKAD